MKIGTQALAFTCLLTALCGCSEHPVQPQEPLTASNPAGARGSAALGGIITNGPSLPGPTIIEQTFVPTNDLFAHTRCRAWRITWPTYPAGTNTNLIPTVFSTQNGSLNSFNFLNSTVATTTYKANFSLYYNDKLETANTLWDELIHVPNAGQNMAMTRFNKSKFSAATIESWVKGRPELFQIYWEDNVNTSTEVDKYQPGDIYQFNIVQLHRYGGIRIVSLTPRIIEVYLAEPNN